MDPAFGDGRSPLVTIMIPTYGQAAVLPQAIESALAQDYSNLEVLVIDDASPDATPEVVERYAHDERIRVIRHPKNLGRVATYRDSLHVQARGDYVLNLDGDDWLCDPTYVSEAMSLVSGNQAMALVFARARSFDEARRAYADSELNCGLPAVLDGSTLIQGFADGTTGIPHMTAIYRRDLARGLDFYEHDVLGSDSVSLLKLLAGRKVGFIDRNVAVWRKHDRNSSRFAPLSDLLANFAVADEPSRYLATIGFFDTYQARSWRRRMSAHLGYRQIANFLAEGRLLSATTFALRMAPGRPLATFDALAQTALAGLRRVLRSARQSDR